MSPQTISATPTNALATAYSNQKKIAVLASGREVAVIGDTTTTAQFWWSDDNWVTKTNYSADVGGWANGAIDVYTDSGGVQRIVVVWLQSGTSGTGPTGGARTTLRLYTATGALNAGETTIAWGAATQVEAAGTDTDDSYNYADIVAHPEGTGGYAHIVARVVFAGGPLYQIGYRPVSIDSSGVPTVQARVNLIAFAAASQSGASITIDPVAKRLFVVASAAATGAGKGIRFRTATTSAGVATWAAEVEVDNGRDIVNLSHWAVCRWYAAGSMVVIGAHIYNGATRDTYQYESTNFTAFTSRALISAGANDLAEGGFALDPATGDGYFAGRNAGQTDVSYYKWTRATTTLGSRIAIESANVTSPYVYVWGRSSKIGFLWTALNSSPYTVKADKIDLPQNTHQLVNAA